jgi:hypothetical protein
MLMIGECAAGKSRGEAEVREPVWFGRRRRRPHRFPYPRHQGVRVFVSSDVE